MNDVIFLKLIKKELLSKLSKFTKWQLFSLKMLLGFHFEWKLEIIVICIVNLLSFVSSSFSFSAWKKIPWSNSQQPKARGHEDYQYGASRWQRSSLLYWSPIMSMERPSKQYNTALAKDPFLNATSSVMLIVEITKL